jgi:hypothetical protein
MVIELLLDDDEDLIRVFTRFPNQTWNFAKIGPKDFARIMASHSGISLWRLKHISREDAMEKLDTPKLKGTAITKAKVLKQHGIRFFGGGPDDPHVSARCPGCNLNIDYGKELCQKADGSSCSFDLEAEISITKTLANKRVFSIDRPIQLGPAPPASFSAQAMPAPAAAKDDLSELENTVRELFARKISPAVALERTMPTLRARITDDNTIKWLVNEFDGYAIAEGDQSFEGGLPPYVNRYRFVFADELALRDPTGVDHRIKGWPATESRLQLVIWSLSDIEERLAERKGDFIYPPCPFKLPDAPPGYEVRMCVHKSQLHRILERFRTEFILLAGGLVQRLKNR